MKTSTIIIQLVSTFLTLTLSAAQVCPPAEVLLPCQCVEDQPFILCAGIDNTVDLKGIFDNASTYLDEDVVFNSLYISRSPQLDLKDGTFEHFKFRQIIMNENFGIRHLSPRAFNASSSTTIYLQMVDFSVDDQANLYEFIRSFTVLEEFAFYEQEGKETFSIHSNAFQNMSSLAIVIRQECNVSRIESKAFSGLPSLTDIYLVGNRIPSRGLPEDAFEGVGGDVTVQLMYNAMDFLEERSYKRMLDQVKMVYVGRANEPSFHCDERADWICGNEGRYREKLEGFHCMGEDYQDVWEYCGGRINNTQFN